MHVSSSIPLALVEKFPTGLVSSTYHFQVLGKARDWNAWRVDAYHEAHLT